MDRATLSHAKSTRLYRLARRV